MSPASGTGLWHGVARRRCTLPFLAAALALAVVIGLGICGNAVLSRRAAEAAAYDRVYYAAVLSGRDASVAVRKARFRTDIFVQRFGMTRVQAATAVAEAMIRHGGGLCSGG
jgi:hypothetical protein